MAYQLELPGSYIGVPEIGLHGRVLNNVGRWQLVLTLLEIC